MSGLEHRAQPLNINDKDTVEARPHYKFVLNDNSLEFSDYEVLLNMVESATEGFSRTTFVARLTSLLPRLKHGLFPGSYQHLLLLLLEPADELQKTQLTMLDWIKMKYPHWSNDESLGSKSALHENLFGSEFQLMRRLVAPVCTPSSAKPIYWITTRTFSEKDMCVQFEGSLRVIADLRKDFIAGFPEASASSRIYDSSKVDWENMSNISLRQLRIDSCKATLCWGENQTGEEEFSKFFYYYKKHLCESSPAKAHAFGWLRLHPKTLECPIKEIEDPESNVAANSDSVTVKQEVQELLFKIALWLAVARGFPAVHLFCDMVRSFTEFASSMDDADDEISALYSLAQLRAVPEGVNSRVPSPYPYSDSFAGQNQEYFTDVWKSNRNLAANLVQTLSLKARPHAGNTGMFTDEPELASSLAPEPPVMTSDVCWEFMQRVNKNAKLLASTVSSSWIGAAS